MSSGNQEYPVSAVVQSNLGYYRPRIRPQDTKGLIQMKCECGSGFVIRSEYTKQTMYGPEIAYVYKCIRCPNQWSM